MIPDPPKPETRTAVLWSTGLSRPTRHRYHHTEAAGGHYGEQPSWLHVFECAETGARRTWGCEERELLPVDPPATGEEN